MAKKVSGTAWLSIAILIVLGGMLWANWDQIKSLLSDSAAAGDGVDIGGTLPIGGAGPGSSGSTGSGTPALNKGKMLKNGSKGAEVLQLQQWLNLLPGNNLAEDGNFGPLTQNALFTATGKTQITLTQAEQLMYQYLTGQ